MPKYLFTANYTKEGFEGVRKDGAQARIDAVTSTVEGMGGKLETFYFAFGDVDAFVVLDVPDDETAAAISLAVGSSGRVGVHTTKLLTADQIDAAFAKDVSYRPPGG
jgi:uncharacterized protein with GYD domain